MRSSLGPVLSGIFMVELENSLVLTLNESITLWQRFVDGSIMFVKNDNIDCTLDQLNSFHEQIQFTYEVEHNNKLPFLDVLLIKDANKIDTTVYRKPVNTDIDLNWNTHAPTTWKRETLRTVLSRAYTICSSERYLNEEIKSIESTFEKVNNYPKYVITQLKHEVKLKHTQNMNIRRATINETTNNEQYKLHLLVLPYAGNKGEKILKSMNKFSTRVLPCNVKTCTVYSGTKLSSKFQLKYQTKKDHKHDVVYYLKRPEEQCTEDYTGGTGRRLIERVKDHSGKDSKSHLFKHAMETNHRTVTLHDCNIIGKGYKRSKFRRKLAESLHIKEKRSSLNTQEASVPLKLFN